MPAGRFHHIQTNNIYIWIELFIFRLVSYVLARSVALRLCGHTQYTYVICTARDHPGYLYILDYSHSAKYVNNMEVTPSRSPGAARRPSYYADWVNTVINKQEKGQSPTAELIQIYPHASELRPNPAKSIYYFTASEKMLLFRLAHKSISTQCTSNSMLLIILLIAYRVVYGSVTRQALSKENIYWGIKTQDRCRN